MWYSFPPEHFPPHFTWQTSHFPSSSSVSSSPSPSRKGNKSTLGVSTLGVCQQTQHHHGLWPHSDYLGASEISSSSYNPPSYAQLPSSLPLSPCPHPLLDKNATHPIAATLGRQFKVGRPSPFGQCHFKPGVPDPVFLNKSQGHRHYQIISRSTLEHTFEAFIMCIYYIRDSYRRDLNTSDMHRPLRICTEYTHRICTYTIKHNSTNVISILRHQVSCMARTGTPASQEREWSPLSRCLPFGRQGTYLPMSPSPGFQQNLRAERSHSFNTKTCMKTGFCFRTEGIQVTRISFLVKSHR